ncbi:hypothetical protein [Gallaecimonas mangrovi]|uniref:hypothetical protein n=1 Tax=Gallaecimonas mangrovi TaxID=2291597 RepID=UPI000E2036FB|nr:hypothetical protein [Gallaecimonas mangrovi]
MFKVVLISLAILSFYGVIKTSSDFIKTWKIEVPWHWRQWGQPEFIDLYRGLFGPYWAVIFGKECEGLYSPLLVRKRNDIRFALLIFVILMLANTGLGYMGFHPGVRL